MLGSAYHLRGLGFFGFGGVGNWTEPDALCYSRPRLSLGISLVI